LQNMILSSASSIVQNSYSLNARDNNGPLLKQYIYTVKHENDASILARVWHDSMPCKRCIIDELER
jgi:hypothetical protein